MEQEEKFYQIALLEVEGIGSTVAKQLISHFGSAKEIFKQSQKNLSGLNKIGRNIIFERKNKEIFKIAENEIAHCENSNVEIIGLDDVKYPQRLKHCIDGPLILYYKGNADLNNPKVISIVGTRNATQYGKDICDSIIKELKDHNALIVSGLAYGIDISSHYGAINNNLPTVGVLAHGLDRIYPREHADIAKQMIEHGGLLTENRIGTNPDRENFPKRNRIVAGMCDATIVIESAIRGGSIITANIANNYSRDVFAVPGRIGAKQSEGCNHLIKINKAHLLQSVKDISYLLGWDIEIKKPKVIQKQFFVELSAEQEKIIETFNGLTKVSIDEIAIRSNLPMSIVSAQLLMLEFKGMVKQLAGKKYEMT